MERLVFLGTHGKNNVDLCSVYCKAYLGIRNCEDISLAGYLRKGFTLGLF
jgi:hypothetical protein